ncbi:M15 family metallopeptidase [Roseateles sp. BYS180W]|uniref:M15 family metallopeptidase n=1 Tax=Roseateles rivi TaxID=3299028 RepID=A0ABW7FS51_9BURK
MVLLASLLYLLLVSFVAALVVVPHWRQRLIERAGALWSYGLQTLGQGGSRIKCIRMSWPFVWKALELLTGGLSRNWRWLSVATGVLILVPCLAIWLRHHNAYDGFDHTESREINPQIAALLQGERLVPPAPLPPDLFLTRDVERDRPSTSSANRDWALLDEEFRNRLLAVYRIMREEHGIEMVLLEGYRSAQRQAQLAGMGPTVTQAGAGESYHQYGLAADSAFLFDGRVVISERDPRAAKAYELFGEVARTAGLVWGGGWRTLKDLGHVELRRPGVIRQKTAAHSSH